MKASKVLGSIVLTLTLASCETGLPTGPSVQPSKAPVFGTLIVVNYCQEAMSIKVLKAGAAYVLVPSGGEVRLALEVGRYAVEVSTETLPAWYWRVIVKEGSKTTMAPSCGGVEDPLT